MNIAYITNIRIPTEKAHGIQVMKMCEAFCVANSSVELIVPCRFNPIKADPFEFYKARPNFRITKLWCVDFLATPIFKWLSFWLQTISFLISVKLFLRSKKFDVYYTRDFLISAFLNKNNTKLIYEIHSMPESGLWLHKKAWARADYLVVISDGLRKALVVYGVDANKIILARDAVDLNMFQISLQREGAREVLGLSKDKKIVIYTGHLYKWKGADILAQVAEFLPSVEIYLVGGTKEDVERFKMQYHFKNLHIIGWQAQSQIPLWLKSADILVLPNSAREKIGAEHTSPLKLFEYMASGTPIVASDVPALKEVIGGGEAIFFQPDDAISLADALKYSLVNSSKLEALALSAIKRVRQFTWSNRAEAILKKIND